MAINSLHNEVCNEADYITFIFLTKLKMSLKSSVNTYYKLQALVIQHIKYIRSFISFPIEYKRIGINNNCVIHCAVCLKLHLYMTKMKILLLHIITNSIVLCTAKNH